jgi:hypothetical protein
MRTRCLARCAEAVVATMVVGNDIVLRVRDVAMAIRDRL